MPAIVYGFSIMEMTGLPSGTVYPAMRRLERDELIRSQWERQSIADAEQRPPRKYYKLTAAGKATLEAARKRYPLLERLIPAEEAKQHEAAIQRAHLPVRRRSTAYSLAPRSFPPARGLAPRMVC